MGQVTNIKQADRAQMIIALQTSHMDLLRWQSCVNCDSWNKQKQICTNFNVLPPAEIIAVGCTEWINIPF